jgi:hypothetical protein
MAVLLQPAYVPGRSGFDVCMLQIGFDDRFGNPQAAVAKVNLAAHSK